MRPVLRRPRLQTEQGELGTLGKQQAKANHKGEEDEHTTKSMAKLLLMMMQMVRDLNAAALGTFIGPTYTS